MPEFRILNVKALDPPVELRGGDRILYAFAVESGVFTLSGCRVVLAFDGTYRLMFNRQGGVGRTFVYNPEHQSQMIQAAIEFHEAREPRRRAIKEARRQRSRAHRNSCSADTPVATASSQDTVREHSPAS